MGQINAGSITPGTIVDDDIAVGAGVTASKLKHHTPFCSDLGFNTTATPTTITRTLFIAEGTGTIVGFMALLHDTGTTTNIDFDLKVNGSSILSAPVNITHSVADGTAVYGTVASGALVAGNRVTVVMTVTSSTGAQGPVVQARINYNYV